MIEPVPDLPDNVLGFRAIGRITSEDYETVLIPAVEAKLAENKKVRLLYCLGEDFEGFEAGAMWNDAKVGLRHFTAWERIAIVTDVEWIRVSAKIFGFAMPGHVRVFNNGELNEAIEWLSQ
jgi:hypothetical protein